MQIISARNPKATETGIELLVTFAELGGVPFHAVPDDPEPHCRELYARAASGEFGQP